jgi:hypothetical protein
MLSRWSWFSSAATKKRAPEHEFSSRAIVLALLVCGVAGVFWQQFVGAAVFIGESDRLNTYLNMRRRSQFIKRCSLAHRPPSNDTDVVGS